MSAPAADRALGGVVHGSPSGYLSGCRSRGACPHRGSTTFLTCVDAQAARQRDHAFRRLPLDQPVPASVAPTGIEQADGRRRIHGTQWGYRSGCRSRRECPNWRLGRLTCPDARRTYLEQWSRDRLAGNGTPVPHGTSQGYLLGCRRDDCGPLGQGITCVEARAAYLRTRRSALPSATRLVGSDAARRHVVDLIASGLSCREVARLAGVSRAVVSELSRRSDAADGVRRMHVDTEARILAVAVERQAGR